MAQESYTVFWDRDAPSGLDAAGKIQWAINAASALALSGTAMSSQLYNPSGDRYTTSTNLSAPAGAQNPQGIARVALAGYLTNWTLTTAGTAPANTYRAAWSTSFATPTTVTSGTTTLTQGSSVSALTNKQWYYLSGYVYYRDTAGDPDTQTTPLVICVNNTDNDYAGANVRQIKSQILMKSRVRLEIQPGASLAYSMRGGLNGVQDSNIAGWMMDGNGAADVSIRGDWRKRRGTALGLVESWGADKGAIDLRWRLYPGTGTVPKHIRASWLDMSNSGEARWHIRGIHILDQDGTGNGSNGYYNERSAWTPRSFGDTAGEIAAVRARTPRQILWEYTSCQNAPSGYGSMQVSGLIDSCVRYTRQEGGTLVRFECDGGSNTGYGTYGVQRVDCDLNYAENGNATQTLSPALAKYNGITNVKITNIYGASMLRLVGSGRAINGGGVSGCSVTYGRAWGGQTAMSQQNPTPPTTESRDVYDQLQSFGTAWDGSSKYWTNVKHNGTFSSATVHGSTKDTTAVKSAAGVLAEWQAAVNLALGSASTNPPQPPIVTGSVANAGTTSATSIDFSWTESVTSPAVTFQYHVDGSSGTATAGGGTTPSKSLTGLGTGAHTFVVDAINTDGTASSDSYAWTITAGTPAPARPVIVTKPPDIAAPPSATWAWTETITPATFTVLIDGGTVASGGTATSYQTTLTDGAHSFQVFAVNGAGTSSGTAHNFSVSSVSSVHQINPQTYTGNSLSLVGGWSRNSATGGTIVLPRIDDAGQNDVLFAVGAWEDNTGASGSGPTRLYFRHSTTNVGSYAATSKSSALTAGTANNELRDLSTEIQSTDTTDEILGPVATGASTATQYLYLGKFVSAPINVGTVSAQNITMGLVANEGNNAANMFFRSSIYVLNGTADTVRGLLYDGTAAIGSEISTNRLDRMGTVAGSAVTTAVSGVDRIVCEIWLGGAQDTAVSYNTRFRYDGTQVPVDGGAENLTAASYIEFSQALFSAGAAGSWTAPGDWTAIGTAVVAGAGGNLNSKIWRRSLTAGTVEPSQYEFVAPSDTGGGAMSIVAYSGQDLDLMGTTSARVATGTGTAPAGSAVITTRDGGGALMFIGSRDAPTTYSFPSAAWVEAFNEKETGSTQTHFLAAAYEPLNTAGTASPLTSTLDTSTAWSTFTIPLMPGTVAAPGTADVLMDTEIDSDRARLRILITANSPEAATATVTRQHPSGRVVTVRNVDGLSLISGQVLCYDYELPIRRQVVYTANVYDSNGNLLGQSDPVAIYWDTSDEFLSDPLHPGRIAKVRVALGGIESESYPSRAGVFDVQGRATPITVTQNRGSARGTLNLLTLSLEEFDTLALIGAFGTVLLFRSSPDTGIGSLYLVPNGDATVHRVSQLGLSPERIWEIPYVEVDIPAGDASGGGVTYLDVKNSYISYGDALTQNPDGTYLDIMDGEGVSGHTQEVLAWRGA